jgi:hypothetical protein
MERECSIGLNSHRDRVKRRLAGRRLQVAGWQVVGTYGISADSRDATARTQPTGQEGKRRQCQRTFPGGVPSHFRLTAAMRVEVVNWLAVA